MRAPVVAVAQVASKEQPSPGFDEELAVLPDALQRTLPPGLLQDLGLAGATGPGAAGKGGSWAKTGKALAGEWSRALVRPPCGEPRCGPRAGPRRCVRRAGGLW